MRNQKLSYFTKKRKLPTWNTQRRNDLIVRNKIKRFVNKKYKEPAEQGTDKWIIQRNITIPSSLVRKAIGSSDKFLEYYETGPVNTLGMLIEDIFLYFFRSKLKKGHQIFNSKRLWLSATPDAFRISDNIPVEIKTKIKGKVLDVIKAHYHQLQLSIYCADSDRIIVIIYLLNNQFSVLELFRDDHFINECLPRLDFAFYQYIAEIDSNLIDSHFKKIKAIEGAVIEENSSINIEKRKRIIKNISFKDVNNDYLCDLKKSELEEKRYYYAEESTKMSEITIWYASDEIYERKIVKKEYQKEIQEMIDYLITTVFPSSHKDD
jgi:hypothetical protein